MHAYPQLGFHLTAVDHELGLFCHSCTSSTAVDINNASCPTEGLPGPWMLAVT